MSDYQAKIKRMERSILREISVNLSLLVKDTEGELLSFQKEWTCWHSTNRCSRVCFNSHTTGVTVSNFGLEKFFATVQDVMVYFKLKRRKLHVFCELDWKNVPRNCLIREASLNKTNFWCRFLERFRYLKRACLPASERWVLKWLSHYVEYPLPPLPLGIKSAIRSPFLAPYMTSGMKTFILCTR